MASSSAPVSGCTNFRIRQLLRGVARVYDAEFAQAGLKGTQYSLLAHVVELAPVAPSELAARMGMDASTLTRNLRPLIDKGWVVQGPGADARTRSVSATPAGTAKCEAARIHWKRAQQVLTRALGEDDVAGLHALIDRALPRLGVRAGPESDRPAR